MRRGFRTMVVTTVWAAASSALAQTPQPALAAVETMGCDQLYVEMMAAGRMASGQLDPRAGVMAQEQFRRMNDPSVKAGAVSDMARLSALCSNPLTLAACKAAQAEHAARQDAEVKKNLAQTGEMNALVQNAFAGVDMQRMMAVQDRIEALNCPQPTGPG